MTRLRLPGGVIVTATPAGQDRYDDGGPDLITDCDVLPDELPCPFDNSTLTPVSHGATPEGEER